MIKKKKNKIYLVLGVVAVVIVALASFAFFFVYMPYQRISAKAEVVMATAQEMREDFKQNDIDLIDQKMDRLSTEYGEFEKEAQSVYWASFVPYVADFKNGVDAGRYVISAGEKSIDAIYPYADLIGFKQGESSFVEKSAEERLQTAVLTLDKVLEDVDSISDDLDNAQKKIESIDPGRYPESVGGTVVRPRIVQIKDQFNGVASFFVDAKPLIKQLPEILGKDEKKTYLIIFQNEFERRASGGFLTAYAFFTIEQGKIELQDSTNIYDLDDTISDKPAPPEKIQQYHVDVNEFHIRDSNLSPDYVESIRLFESLYEKSSVDVEYDGIISMDAHVLVDMLTIFGDTEAGGRTFSAEIDERCDCPQVIYAIFDDVGRPVNYIREDRKGILGDLMNALFFKAIGFSPSQYWGPMAEEMFENLDEKHILLYFTDSEVQDAVEKMNYGGRIAQDVEGDYLHINNVNFAGAKSNLFVDEEIVSETIFEDGRVKREVTISFKNPYEHSDCSLERSTLCLNAQLRNWIRFYVPEGSELVEFNGSQTEVETYEDLGKTVFEGFMTVDPKGTAEVTISYTLPESITADNYSLLIQKQPSIDQQTIEVNIDGSQEFSDDFLVDLSF